MAYTEIAIALIRSGKAQIYSIYDLIRTNFADHEIRVADLEADAAALIIPVGMIFSYGSSVIPTGYLECNGDILSRTTYATLYAAIGTAFNTGGESGSQFRVPDMRGRIPIGAGAGSGLTSRTLGDTTIGAELATVSISEMPSHSHGITDPGHTHNFNTTGGSGLARATDGSASKSTTVQSASTGISTTSSDGGSGTGHANVQPSRVSTFIIKA